MNADCLELLTALFLTAFAVRGVLRVLRCKPFISVANARSLTFSGGLMVSAIYFWVGFLKPFLS